LAQELVARDLAECSSDDEDDRLPGGRAPHESASDSEDEDDEGARTPTLYRRLSGIAYGSSRPAIAVPSMSEPVLTQLERRRSRDAERSLLRDNHILPPKHPLEKEPGFFRRVYKRVFSTKVPLPEILDEESRVAERQPLLPPVPEDGPAADPLNDVWETAVAEGKIKTTWQREAQTIAVYSRSLIVTFMLQYSINVASIFAVGRIGKLELGAVSRMLPLDLPFQQNGG
jgi:MATE family multidrug resistance protein